MNDISIGMKFGKLIVVDIADFNVTPNGRREKMWKCKCDCGNIKVVRDSSLKSGNTTSCGCYRSMCSAKRLSTMNMTHGKSHDRLYKIWKGMIDRCENVKNKSYKNYGEKGISVCEEWHDVNNFYKWSKEHGYNLDLSIDRIDNKIGYCPENCRWVDKYTQNNNTSRNHIITYKGKTQTMAQWADELNLSYSAIKSRLNKYGWSVKKAFEAPIN